ncbi:MAG: hypothetical protein OXE81_06820 [Gammaproteobacteria bacterium]|nr:hypothetical protein [Gammaproteobacteria bacterium]
MPASFKSLGRRAHETDYGTKPGESGDGVHGRAADGLRRAGLRVEPGNTPKTLGAEAEIHGRAHRTPRP